MESKKENEHHQCMILCTVLIGNLLAVFVLDVVCFIVIWNKLLGSCKNKNNLDLRAHMKQMQSHARWEQKR